MAQYKYISNISEEEFLNNIVIPCQDEEHFTCVLVKNSQVKTISSMFQTDNLEIKTNRILSRNKIDYFFHIIRCKKTDAYSMQQFDVIYDYIFSKIERPISDVELALLIASIEEYFKLTVDKDKRRIQTGVFGELFTLLYIYLNGYPNIINKYHDDFYSRHDLEISPTIRLEVKATSSEKRIHHFKHTQIMRTDVTVFLSSVMLEESREGISLLDLFERVKALLGDPESIFSLEKIKKKCGISKDDKGLVFAYEHACDNIRFFDVKNLPKIELNSIDGISNIEYDVDCSLASHLTIKSLIDFFSK